MLCNQLVGTCNMSIYVVQFWAWHKLSIHYSSMLLLSIYTQSIISERLKIINQTIMFHACDGWTPNWTTPSRMKVKYLCDRSRCWRAFFSSPTHGCSISVTPHESQKLYSDFHLHCSHADRSVLLNLHTKRTQYDRLQCQFINLNIICLITNSNWLSRMPRSLRAIVDWSFLYELYISDGI